MLGALFPPNGRYALLVALTASPDLFIYAKDLFIDAIADQCSGHGLYAVTSVPWTYSHNVNTSGSRVLRLRRSTRSKASRQSITLLQRTTNQKA